MATQQFTYDDLLVSLKKKDLSPVYLFHGGEDFLADEAADKVIETALTKEEREFNLDIAYGSESDARDIVSHASSFPMMSERRVVVVRETDKLPNKELLSSYIERPSGTTCLVLMVEKPDFRKKPYTTAKRHGIVLEFKPMYENEIPGWITNRVRQQGWDIDPESSKVCAAYAGTSLREIQNELDKLYLYVGQKRTITVDDVRAVVGMSKEFNVFELQRAIGAGDAGRATEILERMLEAGESATMIIFVLTKYFSTLWKLHDMKRRQVPVQEQARAAGINPFFLREYEPALKVYQPQHIETAFRFLATSDENLKTSSADPRQIMHLLLVQLLSREQIRAQ